MFGFFLSLLAVHYFKIADQVLFVIIACFFSVFPDIDSSKSRIGRKAGIISDGIEFLFRHRGIVHSVFVPMLAFLALILVGMDVLGIAVVLGYGSHLLLDMLTKQGVMPFYPLIRKSVNGLFKADGVMNTLLFFVFLALSGYVLIKGYLGF